MSALRANIRRIIISGGLALFFCFWASPCLAVIQGTVTDQETGQPVASASLRVFSIAGDTLAQTITDASGKYSVDNSRLLLGLYFIHISKKEYAPAYLTRLLYKGENYTFDLTLKPLVKSTTSPIIKSLGPPDGSIFLAGAKITLQVDAQDPQNSPLEYRFYIGGTVVQEWTKSNTYPWQTSSSDTGLINLTYEVRNGQGLKILKTTSIRILNPSIEDILEKVADNYALVNDKVMDVTMTSKFNNEPFGSTIYTRHYFKKPDKQRTETFSKPERLDSSKTEIQIVSGPDIYLIDPVSKAKSRSNIIADQNVTQEQLNQMDEVYHLQDFLGAHMIVRKDNAEDLGKGVVMLEATPKFITNMYSKLGIQIDYSKGVKTQSLTYLRENNQDKLKQTIAITDSQKMTNGAWIPAKQTKTLYLTNGTLVMSYEFTGIQINAGLAGYLFEPNKD